MRVKLGKSRHAFASHPVRLPDAGFHHAGRRHAVGISRRIASFAWQMNGMEWNGAEHRLPGRPHTPGAGPARVYAALHPGRRGPDACTQNPPAPQTASARPGRAQQRPGMPDCRQVG